MTEAVDINADQGHSFLVVRMAVPPSDVVQSLPTNLRERVRTNLERARRLFALEHSPYRGLMPGFMNGAAIFPPRSMPFFWKALMTKLRCRSSTRREYKAELVEKSTHG